METRTDFTTYLNEVQVASLILFQVAVTVFLWRLNAVTTVGAGLFAIFLSADLLSFALISYIYRHVKQDGEQPKWLIVGYVTLAILLLASFLLVS
ncbi:MAG: hypothetical protein ACYCPP_01005 [Nitrososphaerales archaeon]